MYLTKGKFGNVEKVGLKGGEDETRVSSAYLPFSLLRLVGPFAFVVPAP